MDASNLGGVVVALMLTAATISTISPAQRTPYSAAAAKLRIVESSFDVTTQDGATYVACIGKVANDSGVPWDGLEYEVEYFDAKGRVIDIDVSKHYGIVIPPHSQMSFRVRQPAHRLKGEYHAHKVSVRWASDASR